MPSVDHFFVEFLDLILDLDELAYLSGKCCRNAYVQKRTQLHVLVLSRLNMKEKDQPCQYPFVKIK